MTLLGFLTGCAQIRFCSPRPERLVNAAHRLNLPFRKLSVSERETAFEILLPRLKYLYPFMKTLSRAEEISVTKKGLPILLWRYRRRWGFFAGVALFFVSLLLANCFVWGIDISGVSRDPETIFADLADVGLSPGVWRGNLDTDGIARRFLVRHTEYAYAGIRLIGMRAYVELREGEETKRPDPFNGYSNLVADASGKVVRCEVMDGERLVKPGDFVTRGDLLISGVRQIENGAFLPARARGKVFCETEDVFETFVSFSETEEVFSGREDVNNDYFILGFCLYSVGNEKPYSVYDEQVFWEPLRLFGQDLPIYRRTRVFSERTEKMTVRDVDRARDLAYDEYTTYKERLLENGGEILQEEIRWEEREDGVALTVRTLSVRDLCREVPFTVQ